MCIAAAAIPAATLAISAVSTVASIGMSVMSAQQQAAQAQAQLNLQAQQATRNQEMQRQQMVLQQQQQYDSLKQRQDSNARQYNLQVQQSNNQLQMQYEADRRRVMMERENLNDKYLADKLIHQRSKESSQVQTRLNSEAANRVYMGEQAKISEAKKKASFEAQSILAKSIGSKGAILASGRTGQSVGLLVNDVERQAGFKTAQETAMAESKIEQATIGMEGAFLKAESDNNAAASNVAWNPSTPYMPELPGTPKYIDGTQFMIDPIAPIGNV